MSAQIREQIETRAKAMYTGVDPDIAWDRLQLNFKTAFRVDAAVGIIVEQCALLDRARKMLDGLKSDSDTYDLDAREVIGELALLLNGDK